MKKFFGKIALCLLPFYMTAIFSCSNSGDTPAALLTNINTPSQPADATTQTGGGQQTGGQTAQPNFLTDWETMEDLYINDGGKLDTKIAAPWNKKASKTIMPESVRFDIKKETGWDVAFNLMNQDDLQDTNYFGLYNKYTGALRIFYYYNKEVSQSATDFAFDVALGIDSAKNPAYYAALKYGIPMDADVKTNVNLLGSGGASKTFNILITPYSGIDRKEMTQGWYAFDIDMSAYTGKSFYTDGSPIQIACRANNKTSVSLGTSILGDLGGTFDGAIDRANAQASSNGTSELLKDISGGASSVATAFDATAKAFSKDGNILSLLSAGFHWISSGFNIASLFTKNRDDPAPQQEQDKLSGKLDLKLNATAQTQGYLESDVATNVAPLTMEKEAFNPDSNIGKGVWNIDKSPEVYFIPETIFNIDEFAYFYDPTSFKVIINKELFPDAVNINTFSYCGIYVNPAEGKCLSVTRNTAFREALGLNSLENPSFNIATLSELSDKVTQSRNYEPFKLSNDLNLHHMQIDIDGVNNYFFDCDGYLLLSNDNYSTHTFCFMLEPKFRFHNECPPTNYPELYVVVVVVFESNGKTFWYSRTYIPNVSEISVSDAKDILTGAKNRIAERTDILPEYEAEYTRVMNEKLRILSQPIQ